jgi:DNA repair photolyase
MLQKDLEDLEHFQVPPAPVHISNSTDPFQPLELRLGHTKLALEGLLRYRHRFTTVTVLTKNPLLAVQHDYLSLLRRLGDVGDDHPAKHLWQDGKRPALQVEVSLAFWREEARAFWDKAAPSVAARIEGIRALRQAGVPVVLRIDPLFPRSPVGNGSVATLRDFGIEEAQTIEDLERLVLLAKEIGIAQVVYSAVKIVRPRSRPTDVAMAGLKAAFQVMAAPEKLVFRGGSWRLPSRAVALVTEPFVELCRKHGVSAKFCMMNLVEML